MSPILIDASLALLDWLSTLWMEVCMFALAAACYMLFFGGLTSVVSRKGRQHRQGKKPTSVSAPPPSAMSSPDAPRGIAAGAAAASAEAALQPVYKALRLGNLAEALEQFHSLPRGASRASTSCAARLLAALAQAPSLSEDFVDRLMDLEGRFDARALEVAAAEAERRGDLQACRQLYQVAGLASIPKTERALELLVRGHVANPASMRALVEEVTAEGGSTSISTSCAEVRQGGGRCRGRPGRARQGSGSRRVAEAG